MNDLRNEDIFGMMRQYSHLSRRELEAEIDRIESGELRHLYLSRCAVAACRAMLEWRVFGQPVKQ